MMMSSTQILELLAQRGGYIVWEKAFPRGNLKRDLFVLKEADGADMIVIKDGAAWQPVLPLETFNDFCERALFVRTVRTTSSD